jgi:C1A family cysteine protease
MQEYTDFFNFRGTGVYHYDGSSSKIGGHTLLVIGYDDTGQYFIVKNSWGTGWGDNGFGKVGYDQVNDGKIAFGSATFYYTGAYANRIGPSPPSNLRLVQ